MLFFWIRLSIATSRLSLLGWEPFWQLGVIFVDADDLTRRFRRHLGSWLVCLGRWFDVFGPPCIAFLVVVVRLFWLHSRCGCGGYCSADLCESLRIVEELGKDFGNVD